MMGLKARAGGGSSIPTAPSGTHVARCVRIIDLGLQEGKFGVKHQVLVMWELPNACIAEGDYAGEPYMLSIRYTLSLHEKANLRRDLDAWRGKPLSDAEVDAGFDLHVMVGEPCMLSVVHQPRKSGEGVVAAIKGVMALPSGMVCPEAFNPLLVFDQDNPDVDVLDQLPGWVKEAIQKAVPPAQPTDEEPPPLQDDEAPF